MAVLILFLQVFGDPHTELQAQLGLASLALAEKNSHKAIQILTQIQVRATIIPALNLMVQYIYSV